MQSVDVIFMFFTTVYFVFVDENGVEADMSNFRIEQFYVCEGVSDESSKFFLRPKNFNQGVQLVAINLSLPLPIGNDVSAKILIEVHTKLTTKHSWTYLFQIEDAVCKMLDRYVGQFWYDIQRGLGMMPHSCPLPRGSYHADNYLMDYQKLKLQTFPFGKIRITISTEFRMCFIMVVSNGLNL